MINTGDYKIFVTHFRIFDDYPFYKTRFEGKELKLGSPLSNGGVTEAVVVDEAGLVMATGLAQCSKKDSYNKKIGRDISIGRALKKIERKHARPTRS